jgi:hypothetical protein
VCFWLCPDAHSIFVSHKKRGSHLLTLAFWSAIIASLMGYIKSRLCTRSSVDRATDCGSVGRRFDSYRVRSCRLGIFSSQEDVSRRFFFYNYSGTPLAPRQAKRRVARGHPLTHEWRNEINRTGEVSGKKGSNEHLRSPTSDGEKKPSPDGLLQTTCCTKLTMTGTM